MLVVLLAVLAALTLLPAMLAIIGLRVNAFPVRFPRLRRRVEVVENGATDPHHGFWYRLSQFVMRYPVRVFLPVLLLLIGFGLPFLGVRFSAPDASILPKMFHLVRLMICYKRVSITAIRPRSCGGANNGERVD